MSSKDTKYIEKIVKKYEAKEATKLDELRELDKKATRGATVFAYIFGSIGSLVLGAGMSVAMGVILKELMLVGIIVGLVGILMVSVNYFIYNKMIARGRKKYERQILELSSELLNEKN